MSCVVRDCKSCWHPTSKIKLHSFPKDPNKRKAWLAIVPLKGKFYESARICSEHFKKEDYDPLRPDRLHKHAVPFYSYESCECCNELVCVNTQTSSETLTHTAAKENFILMPPVQNINQSNILRNMLCSSERISTLNLPISTKTVDSANEIATFSPQENILAASPSSVSKTDVIYPITIRNPSEVLIYRVYNYLQTEYELLKSLNANNDCDLSPLSNILQRTAEAIGITPQMVSAVLNQEKFIKSSCSQLIKSEHDYYNGNSIREGEHTITEENTEDYIPNFKRRKHNTEDIRIKEENKDDYIPDINIIDPDSEEFIIKEENKEIYNTDLRGDYNTEEIRVKEENIEYYIPNLEEEFIINEENKEDFKRRKHYTGEISIKEENREIDCTDFKIGECNTGELKIKQENIEDFGFREISKYFKIAEDDRIDDFAKANCSQHST